MVFPVNFTVLFDDFHGGAQLLLYPATHFQQMVYHGFRVAIGSRAKAGSSNSNTSVSNGMDSSSPYHFGVDAPEW